VVAGRDLRLAAAPRRRCLDARTAWSWFIDIFAAACLVFCITGLFILKMHAGNRPFTWPMVGLGLVLPALLALLFIH
jgi:hypothetical protein